MLIRLLTHHVNNPHLIDKLIIIKGLPKDWIFKKVPQGDQLLRPWEADVDRNIPKDVQAQTEPVKFVQYFQNIRHHDRNYEGFWDERTVFGLRLDYAYGPGREMWEKIVDYIDASLPRGEKMPDPVLVAKDQHSPFETHMARRSRSGSGLELVPADVPVIDLNKYIIAPTPTVTVTVATTAVIPEFKETVSQETFSCECGKSFEKKQALRMHKMKAHKKEAVA